MTTEPTYRQYAIEEYVVTAEPFYQPVKDEIQLFESAYAEKIPVLLKGPTGCGKTRFVEYMAWQLGRPVSVVRDADGNGARAEETGTPLVTVACHEDLTASDLVGRYLLEGDSTRWIDGPLTRAVKAGAICYLDEVVEARKDTTVLIHPLTDHRRLLPIEKRGQILEAAEGFLLVISYNPGYQSALKDLKHCTRQRFISIEFTTRRATSRRRSSPTKPASTPPSPTSSPSSARRCATSGARPRRRRQHPPPDLRRQAHPPGHHRPAAPARSPSSGP